MMVLMIAKIAMMRMMLRMIIIYLPIYQPILYSNYNVYVFNFVDAFLHCIITNWLPTIAHFIHFKQKNNVHGNYIINYIIIYIYS